MIVTDAVVLDVVGKQPQLAHRRSRKVSFSGTTWRSKSVVGKVVKNVGTGRRLHVQPPVFIKRAGLLLLETVPN